MITQIGLIAIIVGMIVYDVFAGALKNPTESQQLRDWGWEFNTMPFMAGFLLGHWYLNNLCIGPSGWLWALPELVLLIGWDLYCNLSGKADKHPWYRYPGWYALLGIPMGAFLWGQSG